MNQSALHPAGPIAQTLTEVGWVLFIGGALVFLAVMGVLALAIRARKREVNPAVWVVGGGVVFPLVVLIALYAYSSRHTPAWKVVPPKDALVVSVTGKMWWWEVRVRDPATGADVVTANEIRIPTGRPIYVALGSSDVIHSFWVPALAGKMDMIPGRLQHLLLSASTPGTYRGQCAEYCGQQHALMSMHVVVLPPDEFNAWLAAQAKPAAPPASAELELGRQAFLAQRCSACHTVRGVAEEGRLGPDLTHVGSRTSLAAGTLPNDPDTMARWIAHTQEVKPGARMPSSTDLDPATLKALAAWLASLK
jgi:cytochrome c oxidase subunit 2